MKSYEGLAVGPCVRVTYAAKVKQQRSETVLGFNEAKLPKTLAPSRAYMARKETPESSTSFLFNGGGEGGTYCTAAVVATP